MTMKGKPNIYTDKSTPQQTDNKENSNSLGGDFPSGDESPMKNNQDGLGSPIRAGSVTSSDCELKSDSSSDEDPNTFEGLLKICGEAGPWQLQVRIILKAIKMCD